MKSKWIKLVTVTLTAILAAPVLMGAVTFHNIVRIYDNSEDYEMVLTQFDDPQAILEEAGIALGESDIFEFTQTSDRTYELEIERAFDVSFVNGGVQQTVAMLEGQTVAQLLEKAGVTVGEEDILMVTADHGCDPSTPSTDHSREYVPLVMAGGPVRAGVNLGTRPTFSDTAATILEYLGAERKVEGCSFLREIL